MITLAKKESDRITLVDKSESYFLNLEYYDWLNVRILPDSLDESELISMVK